MADDSGIDPRYAAQFQRGYDPARHEATPVTPPPRDPAAPVRLPGGPVSHAERVSAPPVARPAPAPRDAERPGVVEAEPAVEHPDDTVPAARRWEEWLLPGLALVLTAAAIWFFQETLTERGMMFGSPQPAEYAYAQIRSGLPGPLLTGAVVALSAWFVLRAVRRRQP